VLAESPLADFDHVFGRRLRLLLEDFRDHDRVIIDPIDDSQMESSSTIRSSWHRFPMEGIGRETSIPSDSPCCIRRSSTPVSLRAC
jgi:hypothetical protein